MFNRESIEAVARDRVQRREAAASVDRILRAVKAQNPNLKFSIFPFPADEAYVGADETHELNPGQPYPIPDCASGCPIKIAQAAGAGLLVIGGAAAAAAWRRRARSLGTA